jgi:hypothetical protein
MLRKGLNDRSWLSRLIIILSDSSDKEELNPQMDSALFISLGIFSGLHAS